jgi:vanillate O-demethylase monooxygenase subunit
MFPKNAWYVACTPDEIEGQAAGPPDLRREDRVLPRQGGQGRRGRGFLPAPRRPAVARLRARRQPGVRLPRPGNGLRRQDRQHARPARARLPLHPQLPVEERYGFIWVWPGDAALADPAAIHHLEWAEDPEWAYGGGLYHINCDYRLMVDNLMDLTHETYVHASSIGQKEIDEAPVTTRVEGEQVVTSRFMENIMPPPFWQAALRGNGLADDVPVDRWQICRFNAPSHVMIEVGVAHAGKGGYHADPAHKASSIVVDFITPETDTRTGISGAWRATSSRRTRNSPRPSAKARARIFERRPRDAGTPAAEHPAPPERKLLMLNIDAGGVQSRRIIDAWLAREAAWTRRGWRHEHDRGTGRAQGVRGRGHLQLRTGACGRRAAARPSRPAPTSTCTWTAAWYASTRCATRPERPTAT